MTTIETKSYKKIQIDIITDGFMFGFILRDTDDTTTPVFSSPDSAIAAAKTAINKR